MEILIRKTRNRSITVLIIAFLALTWQFINYMVVKNLIAESITIDEFEKAMIYASYIIFILLIFAVILLVYSVFRVSIKYSSIQKKEAAKISQTDSVQIPKN
ncbi:MAG: hypothetical protein IPH62_16275 [Ignavibacteriae bacterium]|nr:hypothetical protein [Ignavibacteriota bacterium]